MRSSPLIEKLDGRWYPGYARNWDDTLFRDRILARLKPAYHVLDLGAGAGIVSQMDFRGKVARMYGVDLDPRVIENPMLDDAKVGSAEAIPYADGQFDLVFADNVLEHLHDPETAFREVRRVLKPGGTFLAKTPNKWHYMPLIARATPHSFHRFYNRLRGRDPGDTFPTLYRANSRGLLRRLAGQSGLELLDVALIEGRPEYLRMSAPSYFAGMTYERMVNSTEALAALRILIIVELRKPA